MIEGKKKYSQKRKKQKKRQDEICSFEEDIYVAIYIGKLDVCIVKEKERE